MTIKNAPGGDPYDLSSLPKPGPIEFIPEPPMTFEKATKPGWKTTEFLITVLLAIGGFVLVGLGKIDSDVLMAVLGISSGGYSVSRGLAKR